MSELWKTCRQMQVECKGCGKMDSCTVSPDGKSFKCWRHDGQIIREEQKREHSPRDRSFLTLQVAAEQFSRSLGTCTGTWTYQSATGHPHMAVLRFDGTDGKQYRPFHVASGRWHVGDPAGKLPLYRLPDLLPAQRVYVCEGEKAAEAGRKVDLLCTTSAHGAASATKTDWSVLAGKEVIILPDHDDPGKQYAQVVAAELLALTPPARVKILHLPGLPPGGDLVDWLQIMKEHDPREIHDYIDRGYADDIEWMVNDESMQKVRDEHEEDGAVLTNLSEVKPELIKWLWEGKLALGKLAGWAGAPGDGKSIASIDVAARVTTGAAWPDGGKAIQGSVLLVTAEDGLADTIRPRLDSAGADASKVHQFSMVRKTIKGKSIEELFTLKKVRTLEKAVKAIGDCRLIIIDPVGSFFGVEADSNGDTAVRSILAPIAAMAEACQVAVLLVMHTRKEGGERADDAVMGSRAFTGIVRSMWHIRRDDDDQERRLFLPGKNNSYKATTGLAYRVIDGSPGAKVQWEEKPVEMTADQAVKKSRLADAEPSGPEPVVSGKAKQWLKELLSSGNRQAGNPYNEADQPGTVLQEARRAGLAWRTVQRAASELGVIRARQGHVSIWVLPTPQS